MKPEKLVGLGTDNAAVMVGVNNGVIEKLRKDFKNNHIVLFRCVCHSLQLALSSATKDELPTSIEYLLRETYNWFSHSSLRQLQYKQVYEALHDGDEPLKIPQMAATRWISIEPVVKKILGQYDSLKAHFNIARTNEKCYAAETLYNMYADLACKLYLIFINSVLNDVQKTNKLFESENADPTKLLDSLILLIRSLSARILNPTARVDLLTQSIDSYLNPRPYLGCAFESEIANTSTIADERRKSIREKCIRFLLALCKELRNRLPDNIDILRKMASFDVKEVLKHNKPKITDLAKYVGITNPGQLEKIENQWRNIVFVNWNNNDKTEAFWVEVKNYVDAVGEAVFEDLCRSAFRILALPHSNADVERVFSTVTNTKTKSRNRMSTTLLRSITRMKWGLKGTGQCCMNYKIDEDKEAMKIANTNFAYSFKTTVSSTSTCTVTVSASTSKSNEFNIDCSMLAEEEEDEAQMGLESE